MIDTHSFVGSLNPCLSASPEVLLQGMMKHKINFAILTHFTGHFYNFLEGNHYLRQIIDGWENFYGYLSANPYYVEHSIADMKKHLPNNKFVALHFNPLNWGMGWYEEPVLELLNAYRRFVKPLACYFPAEEYSVAQRLANDFATMQFLLLDIKSAEWDEALKLAKNCPNIFLCVNPYLLPQDIKKACELLGAHRLIMGSNFPLFPQSVVLRLIEESGISEREISLITSQNAKKFFRIGEE
jgi:predicted TIM-barrel fold metal-dependent hydrolase